MQDGEAYQPSYPELGFIDSWAVPNVICQKYDGLYIKIFDPVLKFQFHTSVSQWNNLISELNDTGFVDLEQKEIKSIEGLQIYLQEYSRGFIEGFNSFIDKIVQGASVFKNPDAIARKIYLLATLPVDIRFPIGALNTNGSFKANMLTSFADWYSQGINEGATYKAWSTILMEPVNFMPLFLNEAAFQFNEFKEDCSKKYFLHYVGEAKNFSHEQIKAELEFIETNINSFEMLDKDDAIKWVSSLTPEARNELDKNNPDFASEGKLYVLLKNDYFNSNYLPFNFYILAKVYSKYFLYHTHLKSKLVDVMPAPVKKLELRVIALIYYYNNINKSNGIALENAGEIAAKYGWTAKTSGQKLYQYAAYYCTGINRTGAPEKLTKVTLKNKIKLFETALHYLTNSSKSRAIHEINLLKSIEENEDL